MRTCARTTHEYMRTQARARSGFRSHVEEAKRQRRGARGKFVRDCPTTDAPGWAAEAALTLRLTGTLTGMCVQQAAHWGKIVFVTGIRPSQLAMRPSYCSQPKCKRKTSSAQREAKRTCT
eukprot:c25926_g1_i1.p2 GENE.c25926_g1_i1~~c25926_g1_i1.p2  ORF type:complete len:120 (+),score=6.50 c25926_g1_i1:140-499(+)